MKLRADVTVTDKVITDMSMEDPVYKDVSLLLWESIGQQILHNCIIREEKHPTEEGAYVYSVDIDVKDLNTKHYPMIRTCNRFRCSNPVKDGLTYFKDIEVQGMPKEVFHIRGNYQLCSDCLTELYGRKYEES